MKDKEESSDSKRKPHFEIALPCDPSQFGDFIGGLLGKPQTISNLYQGSFELNHNDIESVYDLVNQRVSQQNESSLIQFTVKIVYHDNSSVLLNSINDFRTYTEVRPLVSTQVHLSWSFLVKFQDRDVPEKQEIDLSFIAHSRHSLPVMDCDFSSSTYLKRLFGGAGYISFQVKHTARTWGADIESLLSGHIKHILIPQSKTRSFMRKHNGKVAFVVGLMFFLGSVAACFYSATEVSTAQLSTVSELLLQNADVTTKIDALLTTSSSGFWGKYFFSLFVFVIFALFLSIIFAAWASASADTEKPSYILLTKKSKQHKAISEKTYNRKWISFLLSVVVSVVTGIIANILFNTYWL